MAGILRNFQPALKNVFLKIKKRAYSTMVAENFQIYSVNTGKYICEQIPFCSCPSVKTSP